MKPYIVVFWDNIEKDYTWFLADSFRGAKKKVEDEYGSLGYETILIEPGCIAKVVTMACVQEGGS